MANRGSFIRSAARATSSAYRRLPIRWRLAGGSALLTLVILFGFAAIVGVLTTRSIRSDFDREVATAADDLRKRVRPQLLLDQNNQVRGVRLSRDSPDLDDYDASLNPVIRVVWPDGALITATEGAPSVWNPTRSSAVMTRMAATGSAAKSVRSSVLGISRTIGLPAGSRRSSSRA